MPSTKIEVAWAVEVKVHKLGASLEAYDRLQPTLATIRLCTRFGTGDKATINKLLVELIQQIEDLIMQDERLKTIPAWARDFRCWSSRCEQIDHITDDGMLEHYNQMMEDIPHSYDSEDEEDQACCYSCLIRRRQRSTVNQMFDKLSKVLLRDFGLKVWMSHVRTAGIDEVTDKNKAQFTKAYLYLPASTFAVQEWDPIFGEYSYSPRRQPKESGSASSLDVPPTPSMDSLARFDRALKALSLRTVCDAQASSSKPVVWPEGDQQESTASQKVKIRPKPKLTMLIRNCDDSEW
ncbi:hypothetical protein Slin15195_G052470 [Septoria linicola]|uniref:Uncharacterized protein n=1 Tax=Septoria linicola TaxID=215465 RepID=A0A9Q9ATM7_9PEZI|nr:hypothetical protein Slin14017_G127950 [Septoria linicola]USW51928.1 hypothetical protein Slin15195_G052470 [Septoria linicola]